MTISSTRILPQGPYVFISRLEAQRRQSVVIYPLKREPSTDRHHGGSLKDVGPLGEKLVIPQVPSWMILYGGRL